MKRALLIGSAGQDGRYLTQQLVERGFQVVGVDRGTVTSSEPSLALPASVELSRGADVAALIEQVQPERCFYLAAVHHSSEEEHERNRAELFAQSFAVHVDGWIAVLEGLTRHAPAARAFYAASSHVFGPTETAVQSEATPMRPTSVYGITKAAGVSVGHHYRERGLHVSSGFLYNHESPLRPRKFVSQRIAFGAVEARRARAAGRPYTLELGSTGAVVDWGYAPDYTDAMIRVTSCEDPGDYVIASGEPHTVADLCAAAFGAVGLDWRAQVHERPGRVTKQLGTLVGDSSKLRARTGWAPTLSFEQLVRRLVEAAEAQPPAP